MPIGTEKFNYRTRYSCAGNSTTSIYNSSHNFGRSNRIKSTDKRIQGFNIGRHAPGIEMEIRRGFCHRSVIEMHACACIVSSRATSGRGRVTTTAKTADRSCTDTCSPVSGIKPSDKSISAKRADFPNERPRVTSRNHIATYRRAAWIIKSDGALCLCDGCSTRASCTVC